MVHKGKSGQGDENRWRCEHVDGSISFVPVRRGADRLRSYPPNLPGSCREGSETPHERWGPTPGSCVATTEKRHAQHPLPVCFDPAAVGFGQTPSDTLSRFLEAAAVTAVRATERAPFAAETLDAEEIADRNTGQDLPYILRYTPSVVVTSDAGAGVGYTGLRIRGTDPTRINVTLNGIPINDSESQAVFWVNMPDLASATDDIQVRGVGTSTLGAGAFGATISLNTLDIAEEAWGSMMVGGGSFNTFRTNLQWNSGRSASGWAAEGRVSTVMSDAGVDRASSDLSTASSSA